MIDATLRALATQLAGGRRPNANQRANALFNLVAGNAPGSHHAANGNDTSDTGDADHGSTRHGGIFGHRRMAVGYILDAATLRNWPHPGSVAQHWHGDDIDPRRATRMACDTDLYAILLNQCGQIAAVGQTHRTATREQRLALRALYNACPLDSTPFGECEIHHVAWFENGGPTELDNLVPLSEAWHHRIHDRGWTLHMAPDRTLTVHRPDGTLYVTVPPPTPLTRRPAA